MTVFIWSPASSEIEVGSKRPHVSGACMVNIDAKQQKNWCFKINRNDLLLVSQPSEISDLLRARGRADRSHSSNNASSVIGGTRT